MSYGFQLIPVEADQSISFEYVHCLSSPAIFPVPARIRPNQPYRVAGDAVLRFGMMEGSAVVDAVRCVYDPQSPSNPEPFSRNGSRAQHIAIVGNRAEVTKMGQQDDPVAAAQNLLGNGAEVVVVKSGPAGAIVVTRGGVKTIPAYRTNHVWTLGSGDVFAAIFAAYWAVHQVEPDRAATLASLAVASHSDTMSLPSPSVEALDAMVLPEACTVPGKAYLAGPFFTLGQRWLVDEARRYMVEFGLDVFSPVHDVGPGPAESVAPADLAVLNDCDVVFAILDGLDSGTVFEVGYARARDKRVYAFAQAVGDEDLKMVVGSGCRVFDDFVTALYHLAWRA